MHIFKVFHETMVSSLKNFLSFHYWGWGRKGELSGPTGELIIISGDGSLLGVGEEGGIIRTYR